MSVCCSPQASCAVSSDEDCSSAEGVGLRKLIETEEEEEEEGTGEGGRGGDLDFTASLKTN